jgi:hypothetical protein
MTELLSSAAKAVLDAADSAFDQAGTTRQGIAAALQAAADQIVPTKQNYSEAPHLLAAACLNGMAYAANELRLIAAELEAAND